MQRVLRWAIPVDDQWHDIGAGYVVETSARQSISRPGDLVEIWTLEDTVIVIGTGHPVPENTEHVGTAIVPALQLVPSALAGQRDRIESIAGLVWHVFAKYDPAAERAALAEEGRRLASIREDLIASGVDPTELPAPLHPDPLPTVAGETVHARTRDAAVRTLEDEATSLAYWLANELGEHVDDQDGETLTQTVQRLVAVKLAPPDAKAVPIADWDDFQVGDVVVQNPALIDEDVTHDMGGRNDRSDFLVRRPTTDPQTQMWTWVAHLGCPDCGQGRIIGYRMDNEHGDHMHTHYVCTFWGKGQPKACGWHGWSVPGWDKEPEES